MAKKVVILLVLVMVITGGAFAQEKTANVNKNWVSFEASLLGGGLRYERMLSQKLSIGANFYWSSLFFFWNELEAGLSVRFYPWGKKFFVGGGLGYHSHSALAAQANGGLDLEVINGVGISPEVGWKIDVGAAGKWYLQPGVKIPITLGAKEAWNSSKWTYETVFGVGVGVVPYFGFGFAFL